MSWIDTLYLMSAGACLTLALVHANAWLRERSRWADFHFAIAALGVFGVAVVELLDIRATTPERFSAVQYWMHAGLLLAGLGLAGFVPTFFRAGRTWLLVLTVLLRIASAAVNFGLPHGINYAEVPRIERVEIWGAPATVAVGVHTHWTHLDELAWLVSILFTLDAALAAWRRGPREERGRILRVAGAILFVYLVGVPLAAAVHAGVVRSPYFVTPLFLVMLLAMGNELSADIARSTRVRVELALSEARLRASEQDLELAAEAAGLGLGSFDLERGELAVTARGRELFGYGEAEPIRFDEFLGRVHPDDRERIRAAVQASVANRGSFDEEYRVSTPDGGWRWLSSRGRATVEVDGPRLRGVTFEVTARRKAEERFRLVFDAAQSALLIVDAAGRILLANQRAEEDFGYPRAELLAASVDQLLPERLREAHAGHRAGFAREPQARAMGAGTELVARRRDGSEFPVEVSLSPLPGPSGATVLAAIVDISKRRENELAAARQRSELAHLSRVAVLGELSASLAHELNQPLAAILSNAQTAQRFLEREPLDLDQLREVLSDIVDDDRRAGHVIRRLRAMLRKEELVHTPLDVNEVVRDVLQIMNSDFVNRGVHAGSQLARRLPRVTGDSVQLQQVLINLLINGCDAMAACPKPRRLEVRTARGDGDAVEIAISDSGAGIPPADLERIFEPFVTTKPQGTGLGLAVCRSIVSAHGGRISACNNPTAGATILVSLPTSAAKPTARRA